MTQATPVTQILQVAPVNVATTNNVVLLVWLVKSMREMSYEPYMGGQDVEICGR